MRHLEQTHCFWCSFAYPSGKYDAPVIDVARAMLRKVTRSEVGCYVPLVCIVKDAATHEAMRASLALLPVCNSPL